MLTNTKKTSMRSKLEADRLRSHIKYKMLHKMWSQKWRCPPITLDYHTPEAFTRCYWQNSQKVTAGWLVYRVFIAVYAAVTWTLAYFHVGRKIEKDKYFIYLTNWSYCLLTIQCIGAAGIVLHRFIIERRGALKTSPELTSVPMWYKIYWIMYSVNAPSAIMVTMVFWAVVFNPELHPIDVINISSHALNTVVVLVDLVLVAHPYKMMHFLWTLIYVFIYAVFTLVYFAAGGTNVRDEPFIYKILDWRSPGTAAATCFGVLFLVFFLHLLLCSIQLGKKRIRARLWAKRASKYVTGEDNLAMDKKTLGIATIVV